MTAAIRIAVVGQTSKWPPLSRRYPAVSSTATRRTTASISLYDAMKGKGNKTRSSLTDERKQEALLTRKAEGMVGDVMCRFEGAPRLGFATAGQWLEWRNEFWCQTPPAFAQTLRGEGQ